MGLDMYLSKTKKFERMSFDGLKKLDSLTWSLEEHCPNAIVELEKAGLFITQGEHYKYKTIYEQIGYWRKANQIHNWFVQNVQDGNDDCDSYEVTKEQLTELYNTAKTVLDASKLVNGTINNGYTIDSTMNMVGIKEQGKVIADPTVAHKLLPNRSGFFFGSEDYDQWYYQDIKYTVDTLKKVLKETDFNKYTISYHASW